MADTDESSGERTEQASQQRREDFRKEGQVAQSREVGAILVMFGISIFFYFGARNLIGHLYEMMSLSFTEFAVGAARNGDLMPAVKMAGVKIAFVVGPVLLVTFIFGILSSLMQVGFLSSWEVITPDLERINPVNGFTRLFKLRSIVEGAKAVAKISLIAFVAYLLIKREIHTSPMITELSVPQMMVHIGTTTFKLLMGVALLMAFLAVLDYGYQWWELEKRMKMTKQEVKEEFKQREGDPLIRSRIRRLQREMSNKRMMEKVPKADVVITNPTHIAVAIMYDREKMAAPVVVAKGADLIAEKIKELARKAGVPIVENKPLARSMFKSIKINQAIPKALYAAVAEVLAYVYKLKGKIGGAR